MDYFSGWCKSDRRLEGYTIIVTGSNTGVGRETAADLYRRGARVIMACRNMVTANETKDDIEQSALELAGTGELVVEELDLCSLESVRSFCARVTSREERVRGVVCNAGVMMCPAGRTRDGFETHIASNHLGHALLTLLLLPALIQNGPSRIVFLSSRIHQFYKLDLEDINYKNTEYTPLRAYANSKIANILFAKALDLKLKEHGIKGVSTYSLHPGIVKTGIGRHFPQTAWSIITYGFQNYLLSWCWKTPRCGAQTSIYCLVDEKCENESGFYYSAMLGVRRGTKVTDITCQWTGHIAHYRIVLEWQPQTNISKLNDCSKTSPSRQCQSESEAERLWDVTIDMLNLRDYDPFTQDSLKLLEK